VGSGPSSFALVSGMLERAPSTRILVLEAGIAKFTDSHLALRQSSSQPFKLSPSINIGFGGTSQLWHNVLAPLDGTDFLARYLDASGDWQITTDQLDKHYRRVARSFGFDFDIYTQPQKFFNYEEELRHINFDDSIFQPKVFVHPQRYLRCDEAFKQLQKDYRALSITLGAEVQRYAEDNGDISVQYKSESTSSTLEVSCGKLVLCAGALNNPLIIHNSIVVDQLPMLGRCLMDHPMGNMFQFRYPTKKTARLFSAVRVDRGINAKVALRLTESARKKHQLPNSAFYLRPSFSEGPDDATERLKLDLLTVRKKLMQARFPIREGIGLMRNMNMVRQVIQYKTGFSSSHALSDCMLVTEQLPDSASRVSIGSESSGNEAINVDVRWQLSERDLAHVDLLGDLIDEHLVRRNGASLTYDRAEVVWKNRLSSAAHHLGTVRMSRDATLGCVNSNLRLHNSDAVFVCDGSVFPTSGNANPTFTCMALADRLSEYLSNA
jgi:choline dehydrogenase-like flavoprotein